ncbi:MAG: choice-of-anchor I family protein [Actinomycetota bacterium]|nr:choice-of-anchor I family protein [Actinomycetota bacterium]
MLFAPDGDTAVVANEGEPSDDYKTDPPGTISVIDLDTFEVAEVGFGELQVDDVVNHESFRTFGPNAGDLALDIEPENITFDSRSTTAWVTLQENNAIAKVDLDDGELVGVFALGFKNWTRAGNAFDASDEDGRIRIRDWPVMGIPQADALDAYKARGRTFLVTANEGDSRDYDGYSEEERLGDVGLCDDVAYKGKDAVALTRDKNLGRLSITTANGFDPRQECIEQPFAYGARSFSIYSADGKQVYDSGSDFEDITADILGRDGFNANNDETGDDAFDTRSDDKGPEPEGVAVGSAYGHTYAFIGLERVGGVMTYRITRPRAPKFVAYDTGRDFDAATPEESGDLGPEGVLFIAGKDSPTGRPLVVLSHEVTGTTTIYQIDPVRRRGCG